MSGFNRILATQPRQTIQTVQQPRQTIQVVQQPQRQRHLTISSTRTPLQPINRLNSSAIRTPVKRTSSMTTVASIPIKKRLIQAKPCFESESLIEDEEEVEELAVETELPGNQQALYDGGYGSPDGVEEELEKQIEDEKPAELEFKKPGFTKVSEESIELGGFLLPMPEKKELHANYHWLAGKADGQYRVVLGYNTLFKPKNPVNAQTGEKADSFRWRVIRFENRYKDNFPYAEFPAKYIEPIIQALSKAKEQYEQETTNDDM